MTAASKSDFSEFFTPLFDQDDEKKLNRFKPQYSMDCTQVP